MKQQNLFLPAGHSLDQLRQMSTTEMQSVCDAQGLDIDSVLKYLSIAQKVPAVKTDYPRARIHHDYEFLGFIRTGTLPATSNQLQLSGFHRRPELIERSFDRAMDLLDEIESDDLNWEQKRKLRDRVQGLFQESLFQRGLVIFDEEQGKQSSNPSRSAREAVHQMSELYQAFDNIYLRRNGYAAALAAFGHKVDSVNEMQAELNFILKMLEEGKATLEDQIKVNKLLRAVKGVYFRGVTTVDAGTFAALVPSLADRYRLSRPKNRLHPGTVLGAEVYDVGVYAGDNFEKTKRPRRYGDGLGRN